MAKVTRTKYNSKKFNKLFGENRPIMEAPKVVHTPEQRALFASYEALAMSKARTVNMFYSWF